MSQYRIDVKTIDDRLNYEERLQKIRIRQGLVSASSNIIGAVHIFCRLFCHLTFNYRYY
jgi:hypothetical protein